MTHIIGLVVVTEGKKQNKTILIPNQHNATQSQSKSVFRVSPEEQKNKRKKNIKRTTKVIVERKLKEKIAKKKKKQHNVTNNNQRIKQNDKEMMKRRENNENRIARVKRKYNSFIRCVNNS